MITENDIRLFNICKEALTKLYGSDIPEPVQERFLVEYRMITDNRRTSDYLQMSDMIYENGLHPSQYTLQGNGASLLISYLLRISQSDPLSPQVPLYKEFAFGLHGDARVFFPLQVNSMTSDFVKKNARHLIESGLTMITPTDFRCENLYLRYNETGYYPTEEDICSEEIMRLLNSDEPLPGIYSFEELELIRTLHPKDLAELVKVEALLLDDFIGEDMTIDSIEELFAKGFITLDDLITTREEVYEKMLSFGAGAEEAYIIALKVRKGMMSKIGGQHYDELHAQMRKYGVPNRYISSCEKIRYLCSRAHVAEMSRAQLRRMYYKVHYPEIY